jgi:AraC-like DNA-binding protein
MLTRDRLIRLIQARDRLREIGPAEWSVTEIAEAAAMSRFHFIRQFKAVFGETPGRFRTRGRLELAKQLLAGGDETITDICMTVGFSSLGSFSALFAKRFGQSPSTYRARLSGSVEQLQPHCLSLLRASWEDETQFSRSRDEAK